MVRFGHAEIFISDGPKWGSSDMGTVCVLNVFLIIVSLFKLQLLRYVTPLGAIVSALLHLHYHTEWHQW